MMDEKQLNFGDPALLQERLTQCQSNLHQLSREHEAAIKDLDIRFAALFDDIVKLQKIEAERNLLQPFFVCFPYDLSRVNEYLALNGQAVSPAAFDCRDFFTVYQATKRTFLTRYNQLMSNDALFARFRSNIQGMRELASMYNTFLAMKQALAQLQQEAKDALDHEFAHRSAVLEAQEKTLSEQLQTVKMQQDQLADAVAEIRNRSDFSNEIEQEQQFRECLTLPLGYDTTIGSELTWDLSKYNGLHLVVPRQRLNEARDPVVHQIVSNIILHFLRCYPAGATRLAMYDACRMLELEKLCADIATANDGIQDEHDRNTIEDAVMYKGSLTANGEQSKRNGSEIAGAFAELYDMLDSSKSQNLLQFNCTHDDAFHPIALFVIYGCPQSYKLDKEKANLIGNARQKGVYLVIVEEESINSDPYDTYRQDTSVPVSQLRDMMTIRMTSQTPGSLDAACDDNMYALSIPSAGFDMQRFIADFQDRVLKQCKKPLLLDKILTEYRRGTTDFSRTLDIPVGRDESGNIKLFSFSSKLTTAHMALIGKTGSGKSSILQAIVLGGAYYYSPDEIEFYLIDMKQGNAFYKKDIVDYSKLKHVKMLSAGCSAKDLKDFIAHIVKTRMSEGQPTDIVAYNQVRSGKDKLKRTVIVIDEYTEITDADSISMLAQIARQGRSYGISLVLSSLKKGSQEILRNNVGNLVEFKNDTVGTLIDDYSQVRSRSADRMFLIGRVGNCISATSESPKISHFRAAFMPDVQQAAFIEQINAKYAHCDTTDTIVVGDSRQEFYPVSQAEEKTAAVEDRDTVLTCTLGKTIYGEPYRLKFGNAHTKKLLLIGDMARIRSVEYSILSAAPSSQRYYFCFDTKADPVFRNVSSVMETENEITQAVQEIYSIYKEREQGLSPKTPLLMLLHDCGHADKLFMKKQKPHPVEEPAPKTPVASSKIDFEPMDGIDDDALMAMLEKYENVTPFKPEAPKRKQYDLSMSEMLRELLEEGIRYGICPVFTCDYDGIRNDRELLGNSISKVFQDVIAVPAFNRDTSYAKGNLLRALEKINKGDILKNNTFSLSELLRSYRIIGKDYEQFVSYEWEELQ